jgi:copper transport protein
MPDAADAPDAANTSDGADTSNAGDLRTWPAALGWTMLLIGTLVQLAAYAPSSRGLPLTHVLDRSLLSATLATREGHALMARLVILALAAIVGDTVLRRARGPVIPVTFTLAVAATWSMTGHASTGDAVPLSVASLTVHVAAMALWAGGLFTVALLLLQGGDSRTPVADVVARFSRLALVAVALVVATGLYQAWREVGHVSALTNTAYGRLLLAKVAVLLVVVGVARRSRGLVTRRRTGNEAALRTSVLIEVAGVAVLLLLAVLLAGNAPAREAAGSRQTTGAAEAVAICEDGTTAGSAAL